MEADTCKGIDPSAIGYGDWRGAVDRSIDAETGNEQEEEGVKSKEEHEEILVFSLLLFERTKTAAKFQVKVLGSNPSLTNKS